MQGRPLRSTLSNPQHPQLSLGGRSTRAATSWLTPLWSPCMSLECISSSAEAQKAETFIAEVDSAGQRAVRRREARRRVEGATCRSVVSVEAAAA